MLLRDGCDCAAYLELMAALCRRAGALAPSTAIAAVDDPPPEPLSLALFKSLFSVQLAPFHSSVLPV